MDRLTWEYKNGGMFVHKKEVSYFNDIEVCMGNAIRKLAKYEDMQEKLEKRIADIKSSTDYPHNFTGQMVEDLEWVLNQIN